MVAKNAESYVNVCSEIWLSVGQLNTSWVLELSLTLWNGWWKALKTFIQGP